VFTKKLEDLKVDNYIAEEVRKVYKLYHFYHKSSHYKLTL